MTDENSATFLSPKERNEVERRLQEDHGHLSNDFDMKYVWQAIKDWKIYIFMFICMAGFCPIYSFALFLPTIIKYVPPLLFSSQLLRTVRNMGYSANDAQLMSVPPYVCACFFTIAASWYADRVRKRGIFMLGFQLIAIAGFSMLAATAKPRVQYAGTILAAIGIYPQIPLGMAWNSANIGGSVKRGTGIAMQVSLTIHTYHIVVKTTYYILGHGRQLRRHHRILRLHQPRRTPLHQRALPLDCHHCVSHSIILPKPLLTHAVLHSV